MRLGNPTAEVFVPAGEESSTALARTTHLAIGAHPDDVPMMAFHGILECFEDDSRSFVGITVTDGSGSPRAEAYADTSDEAMRRIRIGEEREAARIGRFGATVLLDYTSEQAKRTAVDAVVSDLTTLITATAPRVVYIHNLADRHDTHVAVALRTVAALRAVPSDRAPQVVYGCEVWRDLDWLAGSDRVAFDVGGHTDLARSLVEVYASQIDGGKRYDLAVAGRHVAHATFAESHAVDETDAISLAMNLTPLIQDATLDPARFVAEKVDRLQADVIARIQRVGG